MFMNLKCHVLPLVVLSFFSIFSGLAFKNYFFGIDSIVFWGDSLVNISLNVPESMIYQIPYYIKKLPLLNIILGLIFSAILTLYLRRLKDFFKEKLKYIVLFLKKAGLLMNFTIFFLLNLQTTLVMGFESNRC